MVPTKKECTDQNFIWGIEDKYMLTEVKSSNLKPSKKDEAITYTVCEEKIDSISSKTHWHCKELLWRKHFIIKNGV